MLRHVHELYPRAAVFALAFSLGANLLVHALADSAAELSFVAGAAAVGGPWDLLRSAEVLERGLSRLLFSAPLARGLVEYAQRNSEVSLFLFLFPCLSPPQDMRALLGGRPVDAARAGLSVRAFDELVTAPAGGYRDAAAYYRAASTHERVEAVRAPLLCLSAQDDPVCCGPSMPLFQSRNERAAWVETARGGHLGFVDARGGLADCWADRLVLQWFDELRGVAAAGPTAS